MRHLLSYSVYQDPKVLGEDPSSRLAAAGCDGIELLTSYDVPDPSYRGLAETVHLPYAPDWLAAWEDRPVDMPDDYALFHMYGRSHEDVIANVSRSIECAATLSPAHGVFHACNADTTEIFHRRYSRDDSHVVDALCELLNTVVGGMPGGEPPFRILLENLWWPGMRLTDESMFRRAESRLEFDGWGVCLDTGHLMSCLPVSTEAEAVDAVLDIVHGYSRDLIDRVRGVHLHWSATYPYRSTFPEREFDAPFPEFIADANRHVTSIDTHSPFTDPRCADIVDVLSPDYVIHELPGTVAGMWADLETQRSHFPRCRPARPRRDTFFIGRPFTRPRGISNGTLQRGRAQAPRQDRLHELLRHQLQEGGQVQEVRKRRSQAQGEREQEAVIPLAPDSFFLRPSRAGQ